MRTFLIIALAAAVTGIIVGVVIAGSGDGDSNDPVVTPELTVPSEGTSSPEGATGTTGTSPSPDTGGASEPSGTGGSATPPEQTTTQQRTQTQPQEPSGGAAPPPQ